MQEGTIESKILGIGEILAEYPRICCTKEGDRLLANGHPLVQALVDAVSYTHLDVYKRQVPIQSKEFGRIATQNAKNVILKQIREEERKVVYDEYYGKEKEVVTGIVQRVMARM